MRYGEDELSRNAKDGGYMRRKYGRKTAALQEEPDNRKLGRKPAMGMRERSSCTTKIQEINCKAEQRTESCKELEVQGMAGRQLTIGFL